MNGLSYVPFGEYRAIIASGEARDFCTTRPAAVTSGGNCGCASDVRSCVSTCSILGSVLTSKLTVIVELPALELIEYM